MTSQLSVSKTVNSCATAFAEVEAKLNKVTEKVDESISKVDVNSANTEPSKLCQEIIKIKSEHQAISKELGDIKATQDAFIKDILNDLQKLTEAEAQLLKKVGGEETLE